MRRTVLFLACSASLWAQDARDLEARFRRIEEDSGGVLGVSAINLERNLQIGWRANDRFPMMSVYKLPIAIRALALMEAGALPYRKMVKIEPSGFSPGARP